MFLALALSAVMALPVPDNPRYPQLADGHSSWRVPQLDNPRYPQLDNPRYPQIG